MAQNLSVQMTLNLPIRLIVLWSRCWRSSYFTGNVNPCWLSWCIFPGILKSAFLSSNSLGDIKPTTCSSDWTLKAIILLALLLALEPSSKRLLDTSFGFHIPANPSIIRNIQIFWIFCCCCCLSQIKLVLSCAVIWEFTSAISYFSKAFRAKNS